MPTALVVSVTSKLSRQIHAAFTQCTKAHGLTVASLMLLLIEANT